MAKKKKKVESVTPQEPERTEGQWYWCVNCGHHGDFGFLRKKNVKCESCDYEGLCLYTLEEINDEWLDNVWLERFVTKDKIKREEKVPPCHKEYMAAVEEAKVLLKKTKTDTIIPKIKEKSIAEKLAEIKKL